MVNQLKSLSLQEFKQVGIPPFTTLSITTSGSFILDGNKNSYFITDTPSDLKPSTTYWGRWLLPVRRTSGGAQQATINRVYINPFYVPRKMTIDTSAVAFNTFGSGSVKFGIYTDKGDTPVGGTLTGSTASVATALYPTGSYSPAIQLPQGLYWAAFQCSSNDTFVRAAGIDEISAIFDGVFYDTGSFNLNPTCLAVTTSNSASPDHFLRIKSVDA